MKHPVSPHLVACLVLIWLSPLSVSNLSARPHLRNAPQGNAPVRVDSPTHRIPAASGFLGEVSDKPPVCIDGEFSITGRKPRVEPTANRQPAATSGATDGTRGQRYEVATDSLQVGLARVAVLYRRLGSAR